MSKKRVNLFDEKDKFYSYKSYGAIEQNYSWLEMTKKKYSLYGKIWRISLVILFLLLVFILSWLSKKYG